MIKQKDPKVENIQQNQDIQIKYLKKYIKLEKPKNSDDQQEIFEFQRQNLKENIRKYFANRYNFFSNFDSGILLDEESWYSVTPEKIAIYISERYKKYSYIADICCGCGGNTIQFAKYAKKVIAIDIDIKKLCYLMNNSSIYKTYNKICPLQWDATTFQGLSVDLAFSSPPWGGVNYQNSMYDLLKQIQKRYQN